MTPAQLYESPFCIAFGPARQRTARRLRGVGLVGAAVFDAAGRGIFGGAGMTKTQRAALKWLAERNGDGCFDKHGIAFARGETAPFRRQTWNALHHDGFIDFYNPAGKGYGRLRVVVPR